MNGSKPYGPSGDQQTGEAPTRFAATITFPLTPALSLRERENPPLAIGTTHCGVCSTHLANNRTCRRLFPLPVGEGQGEGNRLAFQHSDSDPSRNCRTSR